jgi:hypothetical protein
MPDFIIRSEDDAWELLYRIARAGEGQADLRPVVEGWNPEILYFPDDEVIYSLKPSTAKALAEFHASLSRAYAYILHGQPNARLLANDEKEAIDLTIVIRPGSNIYEFIADALNTLIEESVKRMSGEEIALVLIFLILAFFGQTFARDWFRRKLEERRHKLDVDSRIALSEQETERMRILADVRRAKPELRPIETTAAQGREALTRAGAAEEKSRVLGTELTQGQAKAVLSHDRRRGAGRRLDGVYNVVEIGTENPEGYIGRLRSRLEKREFDVEINFDDLTEDDINTLFAAVREKRSASLHVNAWSVGDKIERAVVMRAEGLGGEDEPED